MSHAIFLDQIIGSTASVAELTEVLRRPKFSRALTLAAIEFHLGTVRGPRGTAYLFTCAGLPATPTTDGSSNLGTRP